MSTPQCSTAWRWSWALCKSSSLSGKNWSLAAGSRRAHSTVGDKPGRGGAKSPLTGSLFSALVQAPARRRRSTLSYRAVITQRRRRAAAPSASIAQSTMRRELEANCENAMGLITACSISGSRKTADPALAHAVKTSQYRSGGGIPFTIWVSGAQESASNWRRWFHLPQTGPVLIQIASPTIYPNDDLSQMVIYSGGAVCLFPQTSLPGLHSVSLSSSSRERQGWLATHGARRCQLLVMYLSGVPYAVRPCWLRKPPHQSPLLSPGRRSHQLQARGRANIYPLCRSERARSTARLAGWIWYVLQLMYVLVHHNLEVEDDPRPCNESWQRYWWVQVEFQAKGKMQDGQAHGIADPQKDGRPLQPL